MNAIRLRSGLIIFLLFFMSMSLQAQQNRFIYIQTDNKQPFYIKIDKKFLSGAASGYIIISKLIDSTYKLSIGFPNNVWVEQYVTISIAKTDVGFILKNFGEKGWGLFNLQTLQVLMCEKKAAEIKINESESNGDEFAKILAEVVNDPSISQTTKIKHDSTSVNNTVVNKIEEKTFDNEEVKPVLSDQHKQDPENKKSEISKLMYDSTAEGINISYIDIVNDAADTVKVFIPINKSVVYNETEKQIELPNTDQLKDEKKNKDTRFIDMELPNPNLLTDSNQDNTVKNSNIKGIMKNAHCKKTATHKDFLKLHKQMAAEKNDNNMIKAANKQFITICFTTEQIKNLGTLFIKEEERYKFYVGAFPFVSDSQNFASLQDQLTDNYYISRFKAMVNQ